MRPVLVVATQVGRRANGGLQSLTEILIGLRDRHVTVATQAESDFTGIWRAAGLDVALLPELGAIFNNRGAPKLAAIAACNRAVQTLVRSTQARVVHCNDLSALWGAAAGARAAGARILFNIRDTTNVNGPKWRLAVALADRTVVNSRDMQDRIARALALPPALAQRLDHVYSIVDLERFCPPSAAERRQARAARGIATGTFAIGVIGAVIPRKQQRELVNALAYHLAKLPEHVHLYLVGDSDPDSQDYRDDVARAIACAPLLGRVQLHSFTADVPGWYQSLDVVLVASKSEGMARCMIESIACGTPVISFDVASAREILEQHGGGRVVAQDDFPALIREVAALSHDEALRRRLAEAGANTARRLFSANHAVGAYRRIYDAISY